jgi:hypothetical protein
MACWMRFDTWRKSSPSATWIGGPNRTEIAGLPGSGHDRPLGMAAYVPLMTIGTAGIPNSMESREAPCRKRPIHPSRDLVPSGYTSRFHPSATK